MATYYWVGGNGTWDNSSKTNWATVSGGAGGNGPPTAADIVNFDANSGTAATVTVAATAVSLTTTINKSDINLSLSGSPTLAPAGGQVTLTAGTITLNNNTLTTGYFASNNSNARTIAFGTGNITCTASGSTSVWDCRTVTNLTLTGTPLVRFTYSGGTGTRGSQHGSTAGGSQATAISITVSAATDALTLLGHFLNIDLSAYTGTVNAFNRTIYGNFTLSSGLTYNIGAIVETFASSSGTQTITSAGKTLNNVTINAAGATIKLQDAMTLDLATNKQLTLTAGTLDLNNQTLTTPALASSNANTRSILFGTGNVTITGNAGTVWSMANATGFTYTGTPTVNFTYSGSTGIRTVSHGSTGGTSANALNLNISAGTDSFNASGVFANNVNFTGFSGTIANGTWTIYGNLTISAGATITAGTNVMTFAGTSGTQQITSNGKTLDFPVTFDGVGGTFACQDALTLGSTRTLTLANGTLQLKNGVTSTVGTFATSGTNQKVLQSTTPGSQATLSDAAGTLNLTYLTVRDIAATGGAKFNALNNCITQGNNSGWYFAPQLGRPHIAFSF